MKHKTSKLLSILLALALVMGIAPAMSQTAQAADGKRGICIAANNPEAGVVSLNGTDWTESAEDWGFDIGSSATVYARVIDDDYVFDGWYEGSERKSSLTSYTFRVENDTVLEARFLKAASIVSAVQVKKSGGNDNFAADAPISTVRIDHSKLTKENVKLTYSANNNVDGYELAADGTVWAKDCAIDADYRNIGGFTLAFADAALLPDGTKRTLEIVFDQITVIRKSGADGYFDDICVAGITGNPNGPIAFSPLSSERMHMALRAEVTFKVNGVDEKDVFLFDARGINNVRGSQNFGSIVNASAHYNYSESMEPASGVVAGSHLYLPADSALRVETGRSSPTLGHRFVGGGTQNNGFNHGFAAAAQAKNGFQSRVWSSAGTNLSPLEIFFLGGGLSHELTVSSGDGGRIELWSDGRLDSASAQNLPGGTLTTPYTYDVPNGKQVTLKMTPDSGHELDRLYVNREETAATEVADSAGNVTHYTYTFDGDQTGEQDIQVTWRTLPITGISLDSRNAKREYAEGEALDVSGLVLTAEYSDGSEKTVAVTEDMVSGFDSKTPGSQTLTVTYEGFEAKYEVEVKAQPVPVTLTGISLDSNSAKTKYLIGEALDVSGLVLTASYSDNSTKKIDVTKEMVSGFDSKTPGSQTLTVTYESFTDTYEVEVKAKTDDPPTPTVTYDAKDGSGNTIQSVTWQKGSGKNLDLTFHRSEDDHLTYGLFGSLEIGGVTVGSANYDKAEGSLKLSIKPEYLETLDLGDHTVKVNFQDGSATVKLTVKAATENPKTGDESIPALWSSLMFLSVAAMILLLLYTRKRKTEK